MYYLNIYIYKMIAGKAALLKPTNSLEIFKPNIFKKDTQMTNVELSKKPEIKIDLKIDDQPVNDIDTLIKMYPDHICMYKDDGLYATPILVGELDLQFSKLLKSDFDKMFIQFQNIFKNSVKKITEESASDIYNKYISIIDEPEKNIDLIFSINLFVLMKYNCYEDFYQVAIVELNKTANQKGGVKIFDKIAEMSQNIKDKLIGTGGSGIIETGINLTSTFVSLEAINYTFGMPVDNVTITAVTIIAETIGIRNVMNGIGKVFTKGRDVAENILPHNLSRLMNSGVEKVSINLETLNSYVANYNVKISGVISEQLRNQYAAYSSRRFTNSISKIIPIDYENLRKEIIDFQTAQGYLTPEFTEVAVEQVEAPIIPPDFITDDQLQRFIVVADDNAISFTEEGKTELNKLNVGQRNLIKTRIKSLYPNGIPPNVTKNNVIIFATQLKGLQPAPPNPQIEKREYKTVSCNVCLNNFNFFPEDGYIHEVFNNDDVDDGIAELQKLNADLEITDELRETLKNQVTYYNKVNIYPCKQFIETLTPEQKADQEFSINGNKLMCSKCCLKSLEGLGDTTWPLYSGTDRNIFSVDKVQDLIKDLSPNELFTRWPEKYNKHRLSCVKFNQIKLNRQSLEEASNKIRAKNPNISEGELKLQSADEIKIVECPRCGPEKIGKFYRVFKKKDIEILYLHCNYCGYAFNGCDFGTPYLITKKQFSRFLTSNDICEFFKNEKMRERRQGCLVKIRMDLFKEIKQTEIVNNWNEKYKTVNEISVKKCPNCKINVENQAGCSAMVCNACQQTFCYVCSQAVRGGGGHDATHFLVDLQQPYGGWYGAQCVNVNFTTIDPDGKNGKDFNYMQNGRLIRPNNDFKMLTRITWKKINYLIDKYTRQNIDPIATLCSSKMWSMMDNVHYNPEHDVCYETGDLRYDPVVLSRQEYQAFVRRCDLGQENPILPSEKVNEEDILDVLDPGAQPVIRPGQPEIRPGQPEIDNGIGDYLDDDQFLALLNEDEGFENYDDEPVNIALLNGIIHNGAPNNLEEDDLALLQAQINSMEDERDARANIFAQAANNNDDDDDIARQLQYEEDRKLAELLGADEIEDEQLKKPENAKQNQQQRRQQQAIVNENNTIEKVAVEAAEAKEREIAERERPQYEYRNEQREREERETQEVIEAVREEVIRYIAARERPPDENFRQQQAREAKEREEIANVLKIPSITRGIPMAISLIRQEAMHRADLIAGEEKQREIDTRKLPVNRRQFERIQREKKPAVQPDNNNNFQKQAVEKTKKQKNWERYNDAIILAQKYYTEKQLANPNDPKLPYYHQGIQKMEKYKYENKELANEPILETRGMLSYAVINYYCEGLKIKGYTNICFYKSYGQGVFVVLKHANDNYYYSYDFSPVQQNIKNLITKNKCVEITVVNLSTIVDKYNSEIWGGFYNIDFDGIMSDQSAVNYIYENLEKWFPRGGKKTLTKKNIKQKKYIKTKNNKKLLKKSVKSLKKIKRGKKSKRIKYLNN
jgi:hypothetical protein